MFSVATNLPTGANQIQVIATDFATGANTSATNTYKVNVAGAVGGSYSYDLNGNCTTQIIAGVTTQYQWDAENRLVKIIGPTYSTAFTYDGFGRCLQIVDSTNGVMSSTKLFLWSGQNRCEEKDGSGNLTKLFYPEGEQILGTNYYYIRDQLGSVRQIDDQYGDWMAVYNYDSFGNQTKIVGSGVDSDFGFAGYYKHAASGLNLTVFRAYNPALGRWLNQDPIGERGGSIFMLTSKTTQSTSLIR